MTVKKPQDRTAPPTAAKPRRKLSYMLFVAERRQAVVEAHPDWTLTEVAKALLLQWQDASAEEKERYTRASEQDYAQRVKEWEASQATTP